VTDYTDVCALSDIPNGKHRAFEVGGRSLLFFRINADVYALENRCTHLDFALEGGRQIGCEIICRQHGARFDIRTGKAVGGPAVDPVPLFDVRLTADRVQVRCHS
jgi:3-phenylpropionate/trans-cinnamate dioxygenase ferredoxin component